MPEIKEDLNRNIIEEIRGKAEELDMNQYLKSTFGGYTKQSVLDYVNMIKRQQQNISENFYKNIQVLHSEKESLKKTNEKLQNRIKKVEAEYQSLTESMLQFQLEDKEYTLKDILDLKNKAIALEEEGKRQKNEQVLLEKKMDQVEFTNHDLTAKLELVNKELQSQKSTVMMEKRESQRQRDLVAELSSKLEAERDENQYLLTQMSEGELAKLSARIKELTEELNTQSQIITRMNQEIAMKDKNIASLQLELEDQKEKIHRLTNAIEESNMQHDKIAGENKTLIEQLEAEYRKSIGLIKERSDISVERLSVDQRLTEAKARITHLEYLLKKKEREIQPAEEPAKPKAGK